MKLTVIHRRSLEAPSSLGALHKLRHADVRRQLSSPLSLASVIRRSRLQQSPPSRPHRRCPNTRWELLPAPVEALRAGVEEGCHLRIPPAWASAPQGSGVPGRMPGSARAEGRTCVRHEVLTWHSTSSGRGSNQSRTCSVRATYPSIHPSPPSV
eukprot:350767-Chlamydomonas_euryale.AAC.1